MKKLNLYLIFFMFILISSCGPKLPPAITTKLLGSTLEVPSTLVESFPEITPSPTPFSSDNISPDSFLYMQDFEKKSSMSELGGYENWKIESDEFNNHTLCAFRPDYYPDLFFGFPYWEDYAVEVKVKVLEPHSDAGLNYVAIIARADLEIGMDYYGSMGFFQNTAANLNFNAPYEGLGGIEKTGLSDVWYTLRLEVAGRQISYYIDNELVSKAKHGRWQKGIARFGASPNLHVCIDDLRAWSLDKNGQINTATHPLRILEPAIELITDQSATGDGNSWGGHQSRIVRTMEGVFTAYTVEGKDYLHRQWRLVKRQVDGTWLVIAEGDSGREPVNLLAAPDGTLYVICWPNAEGTIWSGKPEGNTIEMNKEIIPGSVVSNWPYGSAGINSDGDLCILSSQAGEKAGGSFKWSCQKADSREWTYHTTKLDYRYCYSYVFPGHNGELAIVSTRDVSWTALQYEQPEGSFDYVFNAIGYWITNDIRSMPLERIFFVEEEPTERYPYVYLNGQEDAYLDTNGNMHILYHVVGESTEGEYINRHAVISPEGDVFQDVKLLGGIGDFTRIFQDTTGKFYLLGSSGVLYPAGFDGFTLEDPIYIDLQGYEVEYSGFGVSVPRTGTPRSNTIDVVFPSGKETQWIYFELTLPED